jgi:hypothetical protein
MPAYQSIRPIERQSRIPRSDALQKVAEEGLLLLGQRRLPTGGYGHDGYWGAAKDGPQPLVFERLSWLVEQNVQADRPALGQRPNAQ